MSTQKIVVRVEKTGDHKGHVFGVYATEVDRDGSLTIVERSGHATCSPDWYKNNTRPATILEEQAFTEWFEPRYGACILVKRRSAR